MAKVLIIYYSKTGNTEKMAHLVEEGAKEENLEVKSKRVEDTNLNDLLSAEGIIIGSPTYFGSMASPVKELIDKSVNYLTKYYKCISSPRNDCSGRG